MLCVALLSFDPRDPGFSFTGEGAAVHNRIGPVGAWFADALYFLFGRPAYLLPVILGVSAWQRDARARLRRSTSHLNLAVRIAGFLLCWWPAARWRHCTGVRATCHREPAAWSAAPRAVRSPSGLKLLGATLLLLAAWLAGAAVAFGVSWFAVMDRVGAWTWAGLRWVRERLFTAREMKSGRSAKLERKEALQAEHRRASPRVRAAHRGAGASARPRASAPRRNGRCRCSIRRRLRSCRR